MKDRFFSKVCSSQRNTPNRETLYKIQPHKYMNDEINVFKVAINTFERR